MISGADVICLDRCPVCGSSDRMNVLELPKFPLTGIYVADPDETFPSPDQALMLCRDCGHGYLANVVDPVLLYQRTYTYRTGGSALAKTGSHFFWDFLCSVAGNRRFRSTLEIGCNDLYLMERLCTVTDAAVGLDPIWRDSKPPEIPPNVRILGKFIEELNPGHDLPSAPDLVVAAHTFEHISNPYDQLRIVVDASADAALFVVEVPSFDTQLANFRFDQVFHQHIQYFSLASAMRMVERLGCSYVAHASNYRLWGGTLLIAFRKGMAGVGGTVSEPKSLQPSAGAVIERIAAFRRRCQALRDEIEAFEGVRYGFGAAQMLPILAYHMESDLAFLSAILDDNVERIGMFFPGWKTPIKSPETCTDIREAGVVITALDSCRPIMRRLLDMDPRAIFYPIFKM